MWIVAICFICGIGIGKHKYQIETVLWIFKSWQTHEYTFYSSILNHCTSRCSVAVTHSSGTEAQWNFTVLSIYLTCRICFHTIPTESEVYFKHQSLLLLCFSLSFWSHPRIISSHLHLGWKYLYLCLAASLWRHVRQMWRVSLMSSVFAALSIIFNSHCLSEAHVEICKRRMERWAVLLESHTHIAWLSVMLSVCSAHISSCT